MAAGAGMVAVGSATAVVGGGAAVGTGDTVGLGGVAVLAGVGCTPVVAVGVAESPLAEPWDVGGGVGAGVSGEGVFAWGVPAAVGPAVVLTTVTGDVCVTRSVCSAVGSSVGASEPQAASRAKIVRKMAPTTRGKQDGRGDPLEKILL